ncbi:myb/SANT-like DNA-binding domain-containing protein 4 isoform X1 [Tribolium castaneum]|uniref:Myb/SANT-like DNA-binding domain-containing protein n=2 Tax=Tribolium castaneum TaxID=7070 RepID=D6WUY2_TRICA|nr:PREDICTED: myb/SANT-like DNA-binding domain-containing protein 4 isoform X1 [Tribolium castaneum]EFA08508.2 hypothetical protein TcasGA2_TC006160 [Tribolium castaneum]|eukprot:XP_008196188.1 PREDICTED: myb/SANT-like DNA-binding domain-containing protein 4 isoform X1 [Tribolium castaneum]
METQSFRSLQKKRTTNFREDETKLLIQLWGSPQIQNKLYLTHRKEPVMRLLAANMQQRGFYRTPDEIKTRIRNLKCLYHRIKRTVQSGSGIGTVDPDWPHYKAMDRILSKQNQKKESLYKDNVFEGPRCEDIKQEIDDIDINDDMESYTTNSMGGSEYEEEQVQLPPLTPAPSKDGKKPDNKSVPNRNLPKILPNLTIPLQNQQNGAQNKQTSIPSIPFPLLILNGVQPNANPDKKDAKSPGGIKNDSDVNQVLKELLEVQKENLDIERQRLELEKQRLEFERFVGSQLLAMGPFIGNLFHRFAFPTEDMTENEKNNSRKRQSSCDIDLLKDSKILKTLLSEGLKKYIVSEDENDDSGIHNDDNSNSSSK